MQQLSSLRVTAEMDVRSYLAGMSQKTAADREGAASSEQVGVSVKAMSDQVAESGALFARLSRQFVDGFKGTEQFSRAVLNLGRAMDTGAVKGAQIDRVLTGIYQKYGLTANAADLVEAGQHDLAAAVLRVNAALAAQEGQATRTGLALRAANQNIGASRFNTANIAAQFQDIGVTAAMGMSPIQIALQQGTQLSAVFNELRESGQSVGAGLAAAFMQVVNPVSLITIGVIAAGAALTQWIFAGKEGAKSLDEAFRAHEETLKLIDERYEGLSKKLPKIVPDETVAKASAATNVEQQAKAVRQAYEELFNQLGYMNPDGLTNRGPRFVVDVDYSAFSAAIQKMREQALAGEGDVAGFRKEIEAIVATNPQGLRAIANAIIAMSTSVDKAEGALAGARQTLEAVNAAAAGGISNIDHAGIVFRALQAAISDVRTESARRELTELYQKSIEGETTIENVRSALARLSNTTPDLSGAISELTKLFDAAIKAEQALSGVAGRESQGGRVRYQPGFLNLPGDAPTPTQRPNDIQRLDWEAEYLERTARKSRRQTSAFDRDLQSIRDRIEAMKAERDAIGLTEAEAARLTVTRKLEAAAMKDAIGLSPERVAEIHKEADAYARMVEEMERVEKAREAMELARETVRGFIDDFRSGIEQGKGIWQSFANAALNALDRITDKLLDDVLEAIFKVKEAGSDGGGGGIFGWLMKGLSWLFGGGGGLSLPDTAPIPTPRPLSVSSAAFGYSEPSNTVRAGFVSNDNRISTASFASADPLPRRAVNAPMPAYAPAPVASAPQQIVLVVRAEEGEMFRPVIRAESQDAAVKVVDENNKTLAGRMAYSQSHPWRR